jgi:transcriptional regulator with XRE-family HTH domain
MFHLRQFIFAIRWSYIVMSISQIKKLLDEKNLDLKELSEQTGLSVKSIQNFEQQIQKSFDKLQRISDALNMSPLDLLRMSLESNSSERSEGQSFRKKDVKTPHPDGAKERSKVAKTPSEMFCEAFPKLCK